ncbi:MAG: hypothetical protein QOH35_2103 [Acidobacteriaceae bacterium]|jgi:predicted transcriptional regulator|nr:hypothetical protein [Acidobacteriaceae bacterium]
MSGKYRKISRGWILPTPLCRQCSTVLHRKGRVRRTLEGRAFRYRALVSKETVLEQAVHELVERLFEGSPEELVMGLIKSGQVDPARIAELSRTLATKREAVRARRSASPFK